MERVLSLLSPRDAARRLNLSTSRLVQLDREGKFPALRDSAGQGPPQPNEPPDQGCGAGNQSDKLRRRHRGQPGDVPRRADQERIAGRPAGQVGPVGGPRPGLQRSVGHDAGQPFTFEESIGREEDVRVVVGDARGDSRAVGEEVEGARDQNDRQRIASGPQDRSESAGVG